MTSPPSSSDTEPPRASSSFELLAPAVQRWVYDQQWTGLRDAQEVAIPLVLAGDVDVIVAAATAAGKTEAAFLPICSRLASEPVTGPGIRALYIAPLKALINDQHQRLTGLCERLDIPVHSWHGDVAGSRKAAVLNRPDGVLLITPESLEAMFVLRGTSVPLLFANLRYVVVDELHSFLGTERGAQLRSLLHRIELAVRRRVPRIGLSATLGDVTLAADALRPGEAGAVRTVVSEEGGQELALQLRGYVQSAPSTPVASGRTTESTGTPEDTAEEDDEEVVRAQIAADLYRVLRGRDNLVFANARTAVETYADALRELCEQARVPNEFFPHHGSLSKELREDVEAALKSETRPATAVATTTLEMGIDIGSVHSIAQIGAPPSVAALRQRLGRSGRRGEAAVLRVYITEDELDPRTAIADQLRAELVQAVAMLQMLLTGWCEPPEGQALHLSTLCQQLLSLIAQHGGVTASDAYRGLCGPGSPFTTVPGPMFAALLRSLGAQDVIIQAGDGTLLLGPVGDRTVNHYSFYTAFVTPEEYRLFVDGRPLGALPVDFPLYEGLLLTFAGRRWKVVGVDERRKTVDLAPAAGGRPPRFSGGAIPVHNQVVETMRGILAGSDHPPYLSGRAQELLAEGRETYRRYELDRKQVLAAGQNTVLLPWVGSRATATIAAQLSAAGLDAGNDGLTITVAKTSIDDTVGVLDELADAGPADPVALATSVSNKAGQKYDHWLTDELLAEDYARRALDTDAAHRAVRIMLSTG